MRIENIHHHLFFGIIVAFLFFIQSRESIHDPPQFRLVYHIYNAFHQ